MKAGSILALVALALAATLHHADAFFPRASFPHPLRAGMPPHLPPFRHGGGRRGAHPHQPSKRGVEGSTPPPRTTTPASYQLALPAWTAQVPLKYAFLRHNERGSVLRVYTGV